MNKNTGRNKGLVRNKEIGGIRVQVEIWDQVKIRVQLGIRDQEKWDSR